MCSTVSSEQVKKLITEYKPQETFTTWSKIENKVVKQLRFVKDDFHYGTHKPTK